MSSKKALRERILTKHNRRPKKGGGLEPGPLDNEITTPAAKLVEKIFGMPLRRVLMTYDQADICEEAGIHRQTVWRWKKQLGITAFE